MNSIGRGGSDNESRIFLSPVSSTDLSLSSAGSSSLAAQNTNTVHFGNNTPVKIETVVFLESTKQGSFVHVQVTRGKRHGPCLVYLDEHIDNPCTFNIINWKKRIAAGEGIDGVLNETWDGIGDLNMGAAIIRGEKSDFYSLKDIVYEDKDPLAGLLGE